MQCQDIGKGICLNRIKKSNGRVRTGYFSFYINDEPESSSALKLWPFFSAHRLVSGQKRDICFGHSFSGNLFSIFTGRRMPTGKNAKDFIKWVDF